MDGVLAIFESPGLTNGPSEGINSVIQRAKARAKGFRTIENMIVIVYLMTGDLKALPASPYKTKRSGDAPLAKPPRRRRGASGPLPSQNQVEPKILSVLH